MSSQQKTKKPAPPMGTDASLPRGPEAVQARATAEVIQRLEDGLRRHLPPMLKTINLKDETLIPEEIARFHGQWDCVTLYYDDFLQLVGALGLPPLPPTQSMNNNNK